MNKSTRSIFNPAVSAKILSFVRVVCVVAVSSGVASASAMSAAASACPRLPQVMDCNGYHQNLKVQHSRSGQIFQFDLNEKVRTVGTGLVMDGRTQSAIQDLDDSERSFDVLLATGRCQGNQIEVVMEGKTSKQVWTFEKRDSKSVFLTVSYRDLKTEQQIGISRLSCEKSQN